MGGMKIFDSNTREYYQRDFKQGRYRCSDSSQGFQSDREVYFRLLIFHYSH